MRSLPSVRRPELTYEDFFEHGKEIFEVEEIFELDMHLYTNLLSEKTEVQLCWIRSTNFRGKVVFVILALANEEDRERVAVAIEELSDMLGEMIARARGMQMFNVEWNKFHMLD